MKTVANENVLIGNIELLEGGVLTGWAASKVDAEPLCINVVVNDAVIGRGQANIYREDLLQAGINQGFHSFRIPVNDIISQDELEVKLVDAETLAPVNHSQFLVPGTDRVVSASFLKAENEHLRVSLFSSSKLNNLGLQLICEDEVLFETSLSSEDEYTEVSLPVPLRFVDGQEHLFKLAVKGMPNLLAMQAYSLHPVKTPWQYVKESYRTPGFLSQPQRAGHRYETLQYQLEQIASQNSFLTAEELLNLHSVIVEGYEGREKFPKFSLPKVDSPKVSIIVPAYNKFELTYHCIASIAFSFNKTSYEVILADDCSSDETSKAEDLIENLVVSRNEENLRFLKSCNAASSLARGEYIIFLNNDTEVTSFWIDELVLQHERNPEIGMTGSKLINLDGSLQEAGGIIWGNGEPWNVGRDGNVWAPEYNYCRDVDYLTGAAMCIKTSVWSEVGGFSEYLAPCYYEDTDLAFKVREAGYRTLYVPHSHVIHFEGQSHGKDTSKGLKQYQIVNESKFREKWFLAYRNYAMPSYSKLNLEKDRGIEQRILVIDYATPMPNKDAGSYAAIQEIKLIQSLGFKVTFVPDNMAHFGKYTAELQRMGVEVLFAPFYSSVHDVLEKRLPEMTGVYITRYHIAEKYISFIKENSTAKVIFNNADLHFLRELRAISNPECTEEVEKVIETRERELSVCKQADAILCYNSTEHAVIGSHILENGNMHITPWVLDSKNQGPDFESRAGIAFLGGYNHLPNVEAVEYLCDEIMPLLAKVRPDIKLYIYGSNMPKSFKDKETDNIEMVGFAESLDDVYYSKRIFVAPLLSGAGIKGKVLEAMAYGTPCVLTEVAAEGTGLTNAISTSIAQEPAEWVNAIIALYDDKATWSRYVENQSLLVEDRYSADHGHKKMKHIFASVGLYSSK